MDDLFDSINPFPGFVEMRRDDAIRKLEEMGYKNIEVVQTGECGSKSKGKGKKGGTECKVYDQEPKEGEFPGFETPIKLFVH